MQQSLVSLIFLCQCVLDRQAVGSIMSLKNMGGSHQCWKVRKVPFPISSGHAASDMSNGAALLFVCERQPLRSHRLAARQQPDRLVNNPPAVGQCAICWHAMSVLAWVQMYIGIRHYK